MKKKYSLNEKFNINDELYTPKKLVEIIKPELEEFKKSFFERTGNLDLVIWCPFDTKDSEFVIELSKIDNVSVIYSHIEDGKDFFTYEPEYWDIAISNPPFSIKYDIFLRLFSFQKPFAMLMNMMAINYQEIGNLFYNNPIQLLIPDKKTSFNGETSSFCSGYVCKDFLTKDLKFCHMDDNNSNNNFVPATLYKIKNSGCKSDAS